jgi:hypothetical protein
MDPAEDTFRSSWLAKVRLYDELLSFVGWEYLRPFRTVIATIAASDWAARLLVTSSHERLIVECPGRWPIRRLILSPGAGIVHVSRLEGAQETDDGEVPVAAAFETLYPLFEWLVSIPQRTTRSRGPGRYSGSA